MNVNGLKVLVTVLQTGLGMWRSLSEAACSCLLGLGGTEYLLFTNSCVSLCVRVSLGKTLNSRLLSNVECEC